MALGFDAHGAADVLLGILIIAAGLESDLGAASRWAAAGRRVEPDPQWQEHAASRYAIFQELVGRARQSEE